MITRLKNNNSIILVLFITVLISSACSKNSEDEQQYKDSQFHPGKYRIEFDMPGDDFASIDDLDILKKIQNKIVAMNAGKILSTGSGMGTMAISVQIDEKESVGSIKKIIQDIFPEAKYSIEIDKIPVLGQ